MSEPIYILGILNSHGIEFKIEENRIKALDYYHIKTGVSYYTDVTDFSEEELFTFLGYDN